MRPDSELLDWLLPVLELAPATGDEAERLERLTGAILLKKTGREAIEMAMGAVLIGSPSAEDHVLKAGDRVRCIAVHKGLHPWHFGDEGEVVEVSFDEAVVLWDHDDRDQPVPRAELEKVK